MIIDLSEQELYDCDKLDLATKVNYIYGKNGTGKSTLTKLMSRQFAGLYDVRVFQGFEAIVGDSHKLDAVVLGEANTAIQAQIDQKLEAIRMRQSAISDMEKKITPQEKPDKDNLAAQLYLAQKDYDKVEKAVGKVHTDAAKAIKTRTNPQISVTSYNKSGFVADIPRAKQLADAEREALCETLKSEVKNAALIAFPEFDIEQKLAEVNDILAKKVEPKKIVVRLDKNAEKQQFAKMGMHIHQKGDVCAFCGNPISDEVFEELGSFFSADETMFLQREIDDCLRKLEEIRSQIREIVIDTDSFYPEYVAELEDIKEKWLKSVIDYSDIIDAMCEALKEKQKYLFESRDAITISTEAYKMKDFQLAYMNLCRKNNASDLVKAQKEAKEKLRLDAVYTELEKAKYSSLLTQLDAAGAKVKAVQDQISAKKGEIDEIRRDIDYINRQIKSLQEQTVNEQKLADNINKTLSILVGFELEHYEDYDNKGYYRVKDKRTGEARPVDQLSTGEKNVIAFLYFMEKLHEVRDLSDQRERLIIFDDPLNSNDEVMQFLIADKLNSWIHGIKKIEDNTDTVVVLTHNISFYLNICRFYKDEAYQENSVYHLEKASTYKTKIKHITCRREDCASAYEEDWNQLITLYNSSETNAESLLNPIRKIVETYTSFIKVNKYTFCEAVPGAMLLLHTNSHGVEDLNASTNGFSKNELLKIFYACFAVQDSGKVHIKRYWPGIENLI